MFSNTPAQPETQIAGQHSGKPVTITPQAEPIYRELAKLAQSGNYWAQITVNGINQLAAGRLHQNNIFIKPGAAHRGGTEEFVVILPGCKVTAEKLANDGYKILHFEADLNYSELVDRQERPGLYKASPWEDEWRTHRRKKGTITTNNDRLVAICDSGYGQPDTAANSAAPRIAEAPFSGGNFRLNSNGFDLHYTPGERRIGGLKSYKRAIRPLQNQELHGSALLLARTMYEARDLKGIGWVSEFGGSAILTQALRILADQDVKLEKHTAFLVRPTTSPNEAVKAAHAAGLKLDRKFSKTDKLDIIGNRDQLELIYNRLKHEKDRHGSYSLAKATADVVEHGKSLHGGGAFAGTLAAAAGLVISAPAPAAAAAFLTALGKATTIAGSAVGIGKIGNSMVRAWLPKHHDKIKSKF
ncbi:hypothetical protein [Microbulbifer halophilus]|uniref:Uncharacterized protein n=1 Tax=Microbulbifer halophilus TaxID=453963 RepID=A0ABW5E6T8_9GAMM|nr:hypothetical protein [Microbulbifer halophilus]MCW8126056.1 hypothetical protein [Microbulbifer halophilus]